VEIHTFKFMNGMDGGQQTLAKTLAFIAALHVGEAMGIGRFQMV
jgi:hypothetical protein